MFNASREAGYSRAFTLTPPSHAENWDQKTGVMVATEILPKELITAVHINPYARQLLTPAQQHLTSESFLLKNVRMTVDKDKGSKNTFVSASGTRSLPVAYGIFPYANFVGGLISNKGCFNSGALYGCPFVQNEIHWGFHFDQDAQQDIEKGNMLLDAGFRSALMLGYVVVDTKGLREWLEKVNSNSEMQAAMNKNLDILIERGGKAAISTRIQGGAERLVHPSDKVVPYRKRVQTEISRSAALILAEAELNPDHFSQYLFNGVSQEALFNVLKKIAPDRYGGKYGIEDLDKDELKMYIKFICNIFAHNAVVLNQLVAKGNNPQFFQTLGAGKDIDTTFMAMDFEDEQADLDGPKLDTVKVYLGQAVYSIGEFNNRYIEHLNPFSDFFRYMYIARELRKSFNELR
jgi:hypothetical protein